MNTNGYYTLKQLASAKFTDRKSVFIGSVRPVSEEREALDFIADLKRKYSDASHNVYAYTLREGNYTRFSDDGEPQGTAGLPVLDVLRKERLENCALVVTRYFGGTLLGTGGLVRAYSAAAKAAVEAAIKVFLKPFRTLTIRTGYGSYQRVSRLMADSGVKVRGTLFAEDVVIEAAVAAESCGAFLEALNDATGGGAGVIWGVTIFDCE